MKDLQVKDYGQPEPPKGERVWTTQELQEDFTVHAFSAPFVHVTRKADGMKGVMEFIHQPRVYFGFRKA